jgi:hypothetical protein
MKIGKELNISKIEKYVKIVGFEVFTAVTMKNAVFWDVTPCGFIVNRRFGARMVSIFRVN